MKLVLLAVFIGACCVALGRAMRPGKDWTRPYDVKRRALLYAQHVTAVELNEVAAELEDYPRRRHKGEELRTQLLALWRADPVDRRPSQAKPQKTGQRVLRLARK